MIFNLRQDPRMTGSGPTKQNAAIFMVVPQLESATSPPTWSRDCTYVRGATANVRPAPGNRRTRHNFHFSPKTRRHWRIQHQWVDLFLHLYSRHDCASPLTIKEWPERPQMTTDDHRWPIYHFARGPVKYTGFLCWKGIPKAEKVWMWRMVSVAGDVPCLIEICRSLCTQKQWIVA